MALILLYLLINFIGLKSTPLNILPEFFTNEDPKPATEFPSAGKVLPVTLFELNVETKLLLAEVIAPLKILVILPLMLPTIP